jgi:hypothetical protein
LGGSTHTDTYSKKAKKCCFLYSLHQAVVLIKKGGLGNESKIFKLKECTLAYAGILKLRAVKHSLRLLNRLMQAEAKYRSTVTKYDSPEANYGLAEADYGTADT